MTAEKDSRGVFPERALRELIDAVPVGLLATDGEDTVTLANQTLLRALDRSVAEVVGRPVADLIALADAGDFADGWKAATSGGIRRSLATRLAARDAGLLQVTLEIQPRGAPGGSLPGPASDQQGPVGGCVVAVLDETARHRREDEILNTRRAFLEKMAFEVRSSLNAVIGFGDVLAATRLSPDQLEHVAAIQARGKVLLDLLNVILDYIGIDATDFSAPGSPGPAGPPPVRG